MTTSRSGIADGVEAELNPGPAEPSGDVKGPDPAQWDDPEARESSNFDPADGEVKGPDPAEWGDEARKARGAVTEAQ